MTRQRLGMVLALVLTIAPVSVLLAASVTPLTIGKDDWRSGNAAFECAAASYYTMVQYEYYCKIDDWDDGDKNGGYECPLGEGDHGDNTITISNSDGASFDWSANNAIGAVIVKGGPGANIFKYDPQASSDAGLYAPDQKDISHVTFCWNRQEQCWWGETAWSAGNRYTSKGNWATYTPYGGVAQTVILWAGQDYNAGTVSVSPVGGGVEITITLNAGFRFADVDENVKIQDYAAAPSGNPAPGQFAHKRTATTSPFSVVVPANNFYGIHVDLDRSFCD